MRRALIGICVSIFLLGFGTTILAFEMADYMLYPTWRIEGITYQTKIKIYDVSKYEEITINETVEFIVDENQQGMKVELIFADEYMNANLYDYEWDSGRNLLITYSGGSRNGFQLTKLMIDHLKKKTLISLAQIHTPKFRITASQAIIDKIQ